MLDNEFSMHSHMCLVLQRLVKYCLAHTWQADNTVNFYSRATVAPFVEANMRDCNRLAALRTDPEPVPMPRQHKRLRETDWLQRCVSASCTFLNLSVLFFNEILPFSFLPKPDMRKHNRHWWEKKMICSFLCCAAVIWS